MLSQMKQSWVEIGIPLKERDDDILKVMSKVQDKFRKVKKHVAKMKEETRQSHVQELSGRTVNLGPLKPGLNTNIAKGTTDPRVEFISQDHSTHFTDILNILQFQNLG